MAVERRSQQKLISKSRCRFSSLKSWTFQSPEMRGMQLCRKARLRRNSRRAHRVRWLIKRPRRASCKAELLGIDYSIHIYCRVLQLVGRTDTVICVQSRDWWVGLIQQETDSQQSMLTISLVFLFQIMRLAAGVSESISAKMLPAKKYESINVSKRELDAKTTISWYFPLHIALKYALVIKKFTFELLCLLSCSFIFCNTWIQHDNKTSLFCFCT